MAKKKIGAQLFSAILYIAIGILMVSLRSGLIGWLVTIAGIIFIISGILDIVRKNWFSGAVNLIIGIVILVLGNLIPNIIFIVIGVLLAVKGLVALIEAIKKGPANALEIVFPIISVVIGVTLVFAWGKVIDIVLIVGGILLIIDGIIGLIGALKK